MLVELMARGYRGSLSSIYRLLKAFRREDGRRQAQRIAINHVKIRSPRQAMWLLVRDGKELSDDDLAYRTRLCMLDPVLGHAAELGQGFLQVIRERQETDFDCWLADEPV